MPEKYRTLDTEVRLPYRLAYGRTWTRFFEGMKDKKLLGVRCPHCERVLIPARAFCPRCFIDLDEWVECSQEGTVVTWSLTNYRFFAQPLQPPFISALIRLDGTDVNFLHLIGGFEIENLEVARAKVSTGMRVRAVWKDEREGHILDIDHFAPV